VREKNLIVRLILNTHGRFDHTHGNVQYAGLFGVRIAAHVLETPLYAEDLDGQCGKPDVLLDEQIVQYGTIPVQVYHPPGHTPGSACFLIGPFLISGDSLFADSIGRMSADDNSDYREKREKLIRILNQIVRTLSPETRILPGHGQSCTLARAQEINPALRTN
jgi:hydroxyacylglutathione hydrolase